MVGLLLARGLDNEHGWVLTWFREDRHCFFMTVYSILLERSDSILVFSDMRFVHGYSASRSHIYVDLFNDSHVYILGFWSIVWLW